MFSMHSLTLVFHAKTPHIECISVILVAACLCMPVYDKCLVGKPGEKPSGFSQGKAHFHAGRFLRYMPVLPLAL